MCTEAGETRRGLKWIWERILADLGSPSGGWEEAHLYPKEIQVRDLRYGPVRGPSGCGILGPGGPGRPPAPRNCPLYAGRTMATPKPRILPWLVSQLDSGQLEGVAWLDESHTRFRIPWKHGLRQDAQQEDFGIFQVRRSQDSTNTGRGGLRGHWTEKAGLARGGGPSLKPAGRDG